ncbi:stage IV sporulation protein A [Lactonifactor longoviformis]|uniref:Stage IV sporulation protein A n=1 Tax=Lactonifactor longoviformis DSM 17459 TaxID=1122155 RepID=A0A1M5AH08_9CLOT|nr:stage IV sporulation protein A [Lactonifactor longoviformis]POP34494.1 stage IV sporulation protein A [Lactonifactor longoviformis]SHF29406.1 stage IV sporulation protein A [Lactonifactor longoviformis DSM 17459]
MDTYNVYKDIQARTKGEIYIGVVGPVRTGKSTFIRRFMELVALPNMPEDQQAEVRDQLPLSGSGKLITTVEPKFIPKEATEVTLSDDVKAKIRLIDCVGYMVPEATGNMEEEKERMVKTPWFSYEIPFHQAAEVGTQKVIQEHSSIGLVVTCDGSFGEIPRNNYIDSEEKTIQELKKQGKPFLVLVNSQKPYKEETVQLVQSLQKKYNASVISVNCEQLRKDDIVRILEKVLYEFPVVQLEFYIPKWVEMLPPSHYLKSDLIANIKELLGKVKYVRDISKDNLQMSSSYINKAVIDQVDLATGKVKVHLEMDEKYYYEILSEMTGVDISDEYQLIHTMKELSRMHEEYIKVQDALSSVRGKGYGVVTPDRSEIVLEEPVVIKQGNKYGVKIKSSSPSIHMIKANIETEIAPIVGSEEQAKDLIAYIKAGEQRQESIWQTNIFGKSIEQLVEDGIHTKLVQISDESQVKLQDTMQKIVNDSKGGMVCIII